MADYSNFWKYFLSEAANAEPLFKDVKLSKKNYVHVKEGSLGNYKIAFDTRKKSIWFSIYLNGSSPEQSNRKFEQLEKKKNYIEKQYGESLDWSEGERLIDKNSSNVRTISFDFDYNDKKNWDTVIDKAIDKMSQFIEAIESASHGTDIPPGTNLPTKEDADFAAKQLTVPSTEAILNQIEKNLIADGKQLKDNWRMITKENIKKYWFK